MTNEIKFTHDYYLNLNSRKNRVWNNWFKI